MKCPICNDVRMREVVKDNIMIDVCPDCKGVWLDRGELEKLLANERNLVDDNNASYEAPGDYRPPYEQSPPPYTKQEQYRHDHDKYKYDKYGRPYKKKKTMLDVFGDLFD